VHCRSAPTDPDTAGSAEVLTALHRRLVQWAQCRLPGERAWPSPVVAAAHAPTTGYLAAVHLGGAVQLVANLGAGLRTTPDVLARAAAFAEGPATEPAAAETVVHEIREWLWAQRGRRAVDLTRDPRLLRSVLRRIENVAASAPRHRRMDVVRLAHRARGVVTGPLTAGAERALAGLEYSHLDDAEWLRAVAAVAVEHTEGATGADAVLAVIMFVPEPPGSPAIRTRKLAPPATGGTPRVRARFLAPRLSRTSVPCACNDSRRPYW
jgi:hypothetical protein